MSAVVRCDGVSRTYGSGPTEAVALRPADCVVEAGQHIAVTGPSGSGKSTLIHLMAGLDIPTTGAVSWPTIGDRDALRPGPVAMVFQGPSLIAPLSVLENVALPLQLAGTSAAVAVEAAIAMLARTGLESLADKLPEELSGGQAQRVAIVRVLASDPVVIFADEPTSQLDHENATRIVEVLIQAANATGAALVVATHDHTIAARFAVRWTVDSGVLVTNGGTPV
ncbi:MAG: ABC transporter ATP-binding protein [Actinobacteria bacterium]|nr:ABC transporter ATP-binding protein [Actinomycetota bacterium]